MLNPNNIIKSYYCIFIGDKKTKIENHSLNLIIFVMIEMLERKSCFNLMHSY